MPLPELTPAKHAFSLPSQTLQQAVAVEWKDKKKYVANAMPLTSLAYTAIDRIAPQREAIIEALLVYIDTDTLCYRSMDSNLLEEAQKDAWDPVLIWSSAFLSAFNKQTVIAKWQTTSSIMPLTQPAELVDGFRGYLQSKNDFALAAISVLAGGFSSLILSLAVAENHIAADKAYALSRLEETHAEEHWGRDDEAHVRAERLKAEMISAAQFLLCLSA